MEEVLKLIGDNIIYIVEVGGAAAAIYKWIAKPIQRQGKQLESVMTDTTSLMWDRLAQAHDYYMAKGYCPRDTKLRLVEMHKRYKDNGGNHLAEEYEQDILDLPETKQEN